MTRIAETGYFTPPPPMAPAIAPIATASGSSTAPPRWADSVQIKRPSGSNRPPQATVLGKTGLPAPPAQDETARFASDWLYQLLNPTLSPRDRLNLQPRLVTPDPLAYGLSEADGTPVPAPQELQGVRDSGQLAARVDRWYGGNAPATNTVAQNMGAFYGDQYYDEGRGGSVVADTSALDLFNKGKGVCVEIHAGIAAYRRGKGQEAYVVSSSAVSNSHAFLIFKDGGNWYIQNYGTIVATGARTLRDLFDTALPAEVRPRLFKPGAGSKLEPVANDFLTGAGLDQRRFSDEAGFGPFDPLRDGRDHLRFGTEGLMLVRNGVAAYADFGGRAGFGYYKLSSASNGLKIRGAAVESVSRGVHVRSKYEEEQRWLTTERAGRQRWTVFGGVELGVPRSIYWGDAGGYKIGKIGGSFGRDDIALLGEGRLRLEAGYDLKLRYAYNYALDKATEEAYVQGQNKPGAEYRGDTPRNSADQEAGGGPHLGLFWRPQDYLLLRAGVRWGMELSDWVSSTRRWQDGLAQTLSPSAYGEAQVRTGRLAAGAIADIPLLDSRGYRVAAGLAIAPDRRLSIGASYLQEQILGERDDIVRGALEYRSRPGIALRAEAQVPGPGRAFNGEYRALGFVQIDR